MCEITTKCRICGKDIPSTSSGSNDIICEGCKNAVKSMKEFLLNSEIVKKSKKENIELQAKAFSILCDYFNFSIDARPDGNYLSITDNNVYKVSSYYDLTNDELSVMKKALVITEEEKEGD